MLVSEVSFFRRINSPGAIFSSKRRAAGISMAKIIRPSGIIQNPRIGRVPKSPPMAKNIPIDSRANRDRGKCSRSVIFLNQSSNFIVRSTILVRREPLLCAVSLVAYHAIAPVVNRGVQPRTAFGIRQLCQRRARLIPDSDRISNQMYRSPEI